MNNFVRDEIKDSLSVGAVLLDNLKVYDLIDLLASQCEGSILSGGKIIFAGNGSSYSDAQHLSALLTTRHQIERGPLPSVCLGSSGAVMTAIGNDYSFSKIFAREFEGIAKVSDILICLTTSGKSKNIIELVLAARRMGITVVAICGETSGDLKDLCTCIQIPTKNKSRIQEYTILIGHILFAMLEKNLTKNNSLS